MKILTTFIIAAVLTPGWTDAETPTPIKQSTTSRMAITIDDLPVAQPSWHTPEQMEQITHDLLTVLRRRDVMSYDEPMMTSSVTILITYVNRFSGF